MEADLRFLHLRRHHLCSQVRLQVGLSRTLPETPSLFMSFVSRLHCFQVCHWDHSHALACRVHFYGKLFRGQCLASPLGCSCAIHYLLSKPWRLTVAFFTFVVITFVLRCDYRWDCPGRYLRRPHPNPHQIGRGLGCNTP